MNIFPSLVGMSVNAIIRREEFKIGDHVLLGNVQFNPPFKAGQVMHDEARFVHIIHGRSKLNAPAHHLDLSSGDSFLMKCDSFLNSYYKNENDEASEAIIIQLTPDVLKVIYDNKIPEYLSAKEHQQNLPAEIVPSSAMLDNFILSIKNYITNPRMVTEDMLKLKIKELILIIINSDSSGNLKAMLGDLFRVRDYGFKEIIHANLYEDLKLEDLAFLSGMSLSSFKRKFKSVYQESPNKYIIKKRMDRASELLKSSDQRISEIAYDVGYNDSGHFSKTFSSYFGKSPRDYRVKNT